MSTAVLLLLLCGSACVAVAVAVLVVLNKPPKTPGTPPKPPPKPPKTPPKTPPKPPPKTPPKTPPKAPGGVVAPGTGGGGNGSHLNNMDDLWKQVVANVNELMLHLKKKYPTHPNTVRLFRNFKYLGKDTTGRVDWAGVTMGSRIEINISGNYYKRLSDINNTITHEMGHTIGRDGHGSAWRAAFLWLANIAAKELGWQILMAGLECGTYNICNKTQCPSCLWAGGRGERAVRRP